MRNHKKPTCGMDNTLCLRVSSDCHGGEGTEKNEIEPHNTEETLTTDPHM